MLSKTQLVVMLVAVAASGCDLNNAHKDACSVAGDCLEGFTCVDHACSETGDGGRDAGVDGHADGGDSPGPGSGDGNSSNGEYGTVEPLTAQTSGLAVINDRALLGASAVAGNLGCALVGDESSSPGAEASLVQAVLARGESGDLRCPSGTVSILNDPSGCRSVFAGRLPQCAVYKRWSASGEQVAQRLATGGFVTVEDVADSDTAHTCNVELSLAFTGGASIHTSFSFVYNPFGASETFCVH
jgi:hypothetical protein